MSVYLENGVYVYDPYGAGLIADDGYTDIGPSLNAALQTAASNYVPVFLRASNPKGYVLKTPIVIPSGGGLLGAARGKTVITWGGATGVDIITFAGSSPTNRKSYLTVRDLTIVGSTGAGAGKLFNIQHADHVELTRVRLAQTGTSGTDGAALFLGDVTDVKVDKCVFESSAIYTVYHNTGQNDDDVSFTNSRASNTYAGDPVSGALFFVSSGAPTNLNVSGNEIGPCNGSGLSIQGAWTDTVIANNRVFRPRRLGIESSNGTVRNAVLGNIVDYTGVASLQTGNAYGISISGSGNTIQGNTVRGIVGVTYGIEVVNSPNAACVGNSMVNCDRGIEVNNSPRSSIVNNVVETAQSWAIRSFQSDDVTINSNVIHNFGQAAAQAQGVAGIDLDASGASCKRNTVIGNVIDGGLKPAGAAYARGISCNDANNIIGGNVLRNLVGMDDIIGVFAPGLGTVRCYQNDGFNPVGNVAAPALGASPATITNTFKSDATVFVSGGTVSAIAVGGVATGLTAGTFRWPVGQTITITYTVAPTLTVYLD